MNKRYSFIWTVVLAVLILGCVSSMALAQQPAVPSGPSSTGPVLRQALTVNGLLDSSLLTKKVVETVFIILVGYLLMFGFIGIINKRVRDIKTRHTVRKNVAYVVSIILCIVIFFIWIQNINSITIFLGVAGAGLALALQEVILCVAGWFLILLKHPFETGDRIEINGIKGDVIDIRIFQTSILEIGNWVDADQSTGRIVNFPNSFVFKHENYNYSRGFEFIWNEIPLLLTFESDWKRGREIMMSHAKNMAEGLEKEVSRKIDAMRNRYMIYYGKLTPIVYVNIKDSGVELTLRYLTEAKKRRSTQDQVCQEILSDFEKEPTVNLAYPTYRIVKT
ncbi:MAG: mechanosensitive ion channel family protein [Candidatus Omnitrophica bacterium]|nr:mechanosensitive ion channel family protein [Candidatus Omnitrophota bacterium]